MPHTNTAKKRLRQNNKRRLLNRAVRKDIKHRCLEEGTVSAEAMWRRKDGSVIRVRVNGRVSRDRLTGQPVLWSAEVRAQGPPITVSAGG